MELASGFCGESLMWWLEDGTLTISGTGDMNDYYYDTYSKSVNTPWWAYRREIYKIIICDGVKSIGNWAFCECESLTEIKIPDSVTTISTRAFRYCHSLKEINIPDCVTSVDEQAFSWCTRLEKIYCKRGTGFESKLREGNYAEIVYCDAKPAAKPTPKSAKPSAQVKPAPKVKSSEVKWICKTCGYIHEGDTPPTICPICKYPPTDFKKIIDFSAKVKPTTPKASTPKTAQIKTPKPARKPEPAPAAEKLRWKVEGKTLTVGGVREIPFYSYSNPL